MNITLFLIRCKLELYDGYTSRHFKRKWRLVSFYTTLWRSKCSRNSLTLFSLLMNIFGRNLFENELTVIYGWPVCSLPFILSPAIDNKLCLFNIEVHMSPANLLRYSVCENEWDWICHDPKKPLILSLINIKKLKQNTYSYQIRKLLLILII